VDNSKTELCTIRIMFPVESDEKAIEAKKKIAEALNEYPDAQIQFSLTGIPDGYGLQFANKRPLG